MKDSPHQEDYFFTIAGTLSKKKIQVLPSAMCLHRRLNGYHDACFLEANLLIDHTGRVESFCRVIAGCPTHMKLFSPEQLVRECRPLSDMALEALEVRDLDRLCFLFGRMSVGRQELYLGYVHRLNP